MSFLREFMWLWTKRQTKSSMKNVINLFSADYLLFNNDSQCAYVDDDVENCIVHDKDFSSRSFLSFVSSLTVG